jgi:argininosuccinate lyase
MGNKGRSSEVREKAWGGRFVGNTDALMEHFNASIRFDKRMLEVDIAGNIAYTKALEKAGVIDASERVLIVDGLFKVQTEFSLPDVNLPDSLEDIHMAVEHRLTEIVGSIGGKIHSGRSRNDQVNLDERLYLRGYVSSLKNRINDLQRVLVSSAEKHIEVILPGYTHLQQAQPILFAHYTLSLFWMLDRDYDRLGDMLKRADVMPLGSGALAGSTFPIDREFLCNELGFSRVTNNSIDAVSDRDYLIETLSALSILMMHLSRFCEDLITWSSSEFSFVELSDEFSTGSSMMPQKKNPDSLELIRGKTGRVYGNLVALLTMMKGLPLSYSKDMQEDKEPIFDALDTVDICLQVFTGVWSTMTLRTENMESTIDSTALATDLADELVNNGLPFREAHHVVGRLVRETLDQGQDLTELTLEQLLKFSDKFSAETLKILDIRSSLSQRNISGGTGPEAVRGQLALARSKFSD